MYYEQEYKYLLIQEKYYTRLTNEIIETLSTDDLKTIIHYFTRNNDGAVLTHKSDIIHYTKFIY